MELNEDKASQDQVYLEFKRISTLKPQIVDFLTDKDFHGKLLKQMTEMGLSFYMKKDKIFSESELYRVRESDDIKILHSDI